MREDCLTMKAQEISAIDKWSNEIIRLYVSKRQKLEDEIL